MKFEKGTAVEVLRADTGEWMIGAVVFARWEGAYLDNGERFTSYDIDGVDAEGPYWGRFDQDHVRLAGTDNSDSPDSKVEGKEQN